MSETDEIRELDATTVERIAAGEVVERPASAVKELLENSLDADASRVRVSVESGGTDAISVSDDGIGMTESQVRAAVREHTTSKIRDIEDLERGIGTLGFRGEALHAIGAVSRLTITTRPRGGDRGTRLRVDGGDVTAVEAAGCPEGTTVTVEDLFYNVPARRKYLSQDATEFDHVNTIVTNYALANPTVAMELEHDGRETFTTTGQGSLRETVMDVYGREVAESMIAVETEDVPDGPLTDVTGLVSHPETNRAGRAYLSTFVNGRYVRSNAARNAVVEAYGNQLAPDRYPFAVLDLHLPAGVVDVNVHPRKMEVRFSDETGVRKQVKTAVEDALLSAGLVRSSAPRGRSAPDQTAIDPAGRGVSSRGDDTTDSEPSGPSGTAADTDRIESDAPATSESHPTQGDPNVRREETTETIRDRPTVPGRLDRPNESEEREGLTDSAAGMVEGPSDGTPDRPPQTQFQPPGRDSDGPVSESDAASGRSRDAKAPRIRHGGEQTTFGDDDPLERSFNSLPAMRVLGQFHETYVVAETETGLVLIDQHAADERINYERLRETLAGETSTQVLADPVELSLTAREAELFASFGPAIEQLGFSVEQIDDRTIEVTAVPSVIADAADPELLRDALGSFAPEQRDPAATVEAAADEVLADLACYPSITGNTSMTTGSIIDLLERLDACENPYACPHGRPVVIEIDADELADRFERDYPGHTTRRME